MLDYHIHTAYSMDADSSMEEYCERALELGIRELAFTDHIDFGYPHPDFQTVIDVNRYVASIRMKQNKYPQLKIRRGIEAGYLRGYTDRTADFIEILRPDFVINSVHVVNGCDPYYEKYFQNRRTQEYREYLEALIDSLEAPYPYCVVGHIGYVSKRSPYPYPALQYNDFPELIDTVLYRVIYTGHGIELNTSSIRNTGEPMPTMSILKRFRQLGGEIITFGSDAHNARDLMRDWNIAREMLLEAGYTYVCGFEDMMPTFIRL